MGEWRMANGEWACAAQGRLWPIGWANGEWPIAIRVLLAFRQ